MGTGSVLSYILMGAFFGLSAGITPGPLLALVISETLRHNKKAGFKIAVAPVITDLPIILLTYLFFTGISKYHPLLAAVSFLGSLYFIYLGYETIKTDRPVAENELVKTNSLKKGIIANFLNPNPYIFWLTVGTPTAFKAYKISPVYAVLYFLFFYTLLIGSKILIAIITEKSRNFLHAKVYGIIMKILGVALFLFAVKFFIDGITII